MASMIEERMIDGVMVSSFAENGAKERAWHGLGEVFNQPMMVDEAIKACHADFNVEKAPIVALTNELREAMENGKTIDASMLKNALISTHCATMRTDYNEVLGVVSDSYGIVQNADAFKFIDTLCSGSLSDKEHTPIIEACGVLGHGERVFITAKFPTQICLDSNREDLIDMYAVFTTSHDGSGAVRCVVTPIRVVCNNTLQMALTKHSGSIAFRHSSNVMNRLDLTNKENAEFAYKVLNIYELYKTEFMETLGHLQDIRLTETQINNILADVVLGADSAKVFHETQNIWHEDIKTRGRNIFMGIKDMLENGIGQRRLESGSGLWFVNGVTSYYQNYANFKDEEKKFLSITEGNVSNKVNLTLHHVLSGKYVA